MLTDDAPWIASSIAIGCLPACIPRSSTTGASIGLSLALAAISSTQTQHSNRMLKYKI